MSISLSYLTTLFSSSTSDAGSSMLDTLYGIGTQSSGASGQDPVQALQSAEQNQTEDVKLTAAQPSVQTAITAFTKGVNSAKSVTQLLANPAVMNVLLTANNMSDQIGYTALATQALTSNLSNSNSLANTLTDTRWKTLAQTYNFHVNGLASIQNPTAIASIAKAYVTATWQNNEDTVTPGLSNALAFKAQASTITSVDQILGNSMMRTVVTTALGIPEQIAFQPMTAQEQAISSQVDIAQFKSPKFVESFVQRYLIANSANTSSSTSSGTDLTSLAVQAQGILV
jgi:pyruvate/oxaloacetate carboxyltransferase